MSHVGVYTLRSNIAGVFLCNIFFVEAEKDGGAGPVVGAK